MGNPRRGRIPDDLGWLIDELDSHDTRIRTLEAPDGVQRNDTVAELLATVNYLSGLKTHGASGSPALSTGTVPNDNLVHWFATSPDTAMTIDVPTNRLLVTASCGEASITPGGSFVISMVSFSVKDSNGIALPGAAMGDSDGRRYTNVREGMPLSTGQQIIVIDPIANPGPYQIRAFCGMWVPPANTLPASTQFSNVALVAQVIDS